MMNRAFCFCFLFQKINDTKFRNAVDMSDFEVSEFTEVQKLVCVPFAHA